MRITGFDLNAVHVTPWVDWVFVHVNTDGTAEGKPLRGLGELEAGGLASGAACEQALACVALIQRELLGQDPRNVVQLTTPLLARAGNPPPEAGDGKNAVRVWLVAVSAVEQALWDILGKDVGKPVYALLGGSWQGSGYQLRLYANINRITRNADERTPETFATNAARAVAAGHSAIKLGPFDAGRKAEPEPAPQAENDSGSGAGGLANWEAYIGGQINDVSTPDAQLGIDCIRAVREAVGPDVAVLVDVHSRFTLRGARQLLEEVAPLKLHWLEDTVRGLVRTQPQTGAALDHNRRWCCCGTGHARRSDGRGGAELCRLGGGEHDHLLSVFARRAAPSHRWRCVPSSAVTTRR